MHEISIIHSVAHTLETEFEAKQLSRLKAIHLKVGILSNIEPRLLMSAYEAYSLSDTRYKNVAMNIESVPASIECEPCGQVTEVENYRFICSACGKPSKNVIHGEEMLIHKVEFEDE